MEKGRQNLQNLLKKERKKTEKRDRGRTESGEGRKEERRGRGEEGGRLLAKRRRRRTKRMSWKSQKARERLSGGRHLADVLLCSERKLPKKALFGGKRDLGGLRKVLGISSGFALVRRHLSVKGVDDCLFKEGEKKAREERLDLVNRKASSGGGFRVSEGTNHRHY